MGALTTWKATLYGSNTDTAAATLDTTYKAYYCAVSALTAAASASWFIIAPQYEPSVETNTLQDVNGASIGFQRRVATFEIVSWPFRYDATSLSDDQDLDDWVSVTEIMASYKYLYLKIDGGTRSYPSGANVYPVVIDSAPSTNRNFAAGTRTVTVRFRARKVA
jgi:hypothetical protein